MPQRAQGTHERPQRLLRTLRPPARGAQAVQGPHHQGQIRPGGLQQIARRHMRPTPQTGPPRPTRLADVGEATLHPLGPPPVIAFAEGPQAASAILMEGDRRDSAPLVGPPAAARRTTLRDGGAIPLGLQPPEQGGLDTPTTRPLSNPLASTIPRISANTA